MNYSVKKIMRAYFGAKLRWAIFWFALVCLLCYGQIELFYGPLDFFYHTYPRIMGGICCVDLVAFLISLGNLLTRLVTRFNYTGRLRRDLAHWLPEHLAADPYAVLDDDVCWQPNPPAPLYLGEEWLVLPGHVFPRPKIVGIFFEELRKSFLSNKVRLTIVDEQGNSGYLDLPPRLHPALFNQLAQLHPAATNADHCVLRGFWRQENQDYHRLRLNGEPPRKLPNS